MIVFLALKAHLYTVQSLCKGEFGPDLPQIQGLAYEDMLSAATAQAATYIFTDIERLHTWERRLVAELFRSLQEAGCRCLNDPAKVLTRYPLLRALHRTGINPFRVWRLDEHPIETLAPDKRRWFGGKHAGLRPRYPVFVRYESDHGRPLTPLLHSRAELADALRGLTAAGIPFAGLLCVEFCATEFRPGAWAKFNTFRIGDVVSTDHAVIEDQWYVKEGTATLATPEMFQWEHDHIVRDDFAAELAPIFEIASIEYGRADHATVHGRQVIYEVNTNPYLAPLKKQISPVRDEAIAVARARYAAALWQIDSADRGMIALRCSERALQYRGMSEATGTSFRP